MPKNVSCNAFYIFMLETKRRLEANGERFPRGMEDVVGIAAGHWERMSQECKNAYKEKAKDYKKSDEFATHKKEMKGRLPKSMRGEHSRRAPQPRPVEEEDFVEPVPHLYPSDDDDAKEEFRKKHAKDRKEIMDAWRWNMGDKPEAIYDLKFYVVSFISHWRTESYSYFPAEVGIVEFTLRDGLIMTYSKIMGPHTLPPDIAPIATELSELSKIPFNSTVEGMTDDYARVMDEILRLSRPSKNLRHFFCIAKEFNCVQGCVKYLQTRAKVVEIRPDRINCIDDLFIMLCEWRDKSCAPGEWRPFNDCDGISEGAPYYRHPDLLCEYHSSVGVHRCALATAKRAAYYLLERIQGHYHLPKTTRHRPRQLTSEETDQVAANAPVQFAGAARQSLPQSSSPINDDTSSVVSGATGITRRMAAVHIPDYEDIGMPQTLPKQLRNVAVTVPDSWKEANREAELKQKRGTRHEAGSRGTASVVEPNAPRGGASASASVSGAANFNTRPNIAWNQNKEKRDRVYAMYNMQGSKN